MDLNLTNIIKGFTFKQLAKYSLLPSKIKELSVSRMEKCTSCEFMIKDIKEGVKQGRCAACTCWLPEKTFVEKEKCPLNKW